MPWYISFSRVALCTFYSYLGGTQLGWIADAEDSYRRSLTWRPAVATLFEHKIVMNKLGASHVWYRFEVDGRPYEGDKFRSGGVYKEEHLRNPALLGVGTELVVYYNPGDPTESAVKIGVDRGIEAFFAANAALCLGIAYRCVRCETVLPNLFYRFINVNRRFAENTGLKTRSNTARRPGVSQGRSKRK